LEQPHVTSGTIQLAQIRSRRSQRFTGGIDDLFVVRVRELCAPLGSPHQKKKRQR